MDRNVLNCFFLNEHYQINLQLTDKYMKKYSKL